MRTSWTRSWIAAALLAAAAAPAATLYEKDGITLDGSVRMVHRNAATCQVLAGSESPESYERTKANHGRPLHVWRLDYSALNGSGKSLSDLRAHFQIEAEWPPCTNWTGLGQYPGPVQWAGSFETIQRPSGMRPGEEASATTYVLGIDGREPRFGRRQLIYRFGAAAEPAAPQVSETASPAVQPELEPPPMPRPICDFDSGNIDDWSDCWYELASPPACYVWHPEDDFYGSPEWSGECVNGLANGRGDLVVITEHPFEGHEVEVRHKGTFRDGKKQGHWVEAYGRVYISEGPFIDGSKHGRWKTVWPQEQAHIRRAPAGAMGTRRANQDDLAPEPLTLEVSSGRRCVLR